VLAYQFLVQILRFAVGIFFRRIEVVGLEHVPDEGEGGVLFCGNHPNSLLDPILVIVHGGRTVHFAAKDVLFEGRVMRFLLSRLGAVPIRRRMDHGGDAIDNSDTFDRLYDVLGSGGAVGIFPEGLSHGDSHLARLKTGAARIALGSAAGHGDSSVQIVPVGLHYASRHRFRSSVLIQFGEPIPVDSTWLAAHAADEREAVTALTDALEDQLRGLTVNAVDWETIRLLDGVRRLYQPPRIPLSDRVELARRFNTVYPTVKDDPQVVSLRARVEDYLDRLAALGLRDRDIRRPPRPGRLAWKTFGHALLVLLWLPMAIVGAPVHGPVAILLGVAASRFPPRKDVIATTKFVAGVSLLLLTYAALTAWATLSLGLEGGAWTLIGLLFTGYATLAVYVKLSAVDRKLQCLIGTFFLRGHLEALRHERGALEARVVEVVGRLIPEDMEPLYPRDADPAEDTP